MPYSTPRSRPRPEDGFEMRMQTRVGYEPTRECVCLIMDSVAGQPPRPSAAYGHGPQVASNEARSNAPTLPSSSASKHSQPGAAGPQQASSEAKSNAPVSPLPSASVGQEPQPGPSHSSGTPLPSLSGLLPEAISQASSTPFSLQSGPPSVCGMILKTSPPL